MFSTVIESPCIMSIADELISSLTMNVRHVRDKNMAICMTKNVLCISSSVPINERYKEYFEKDIRKLVGTNAVIKYNVPRPVLNYEYHKYL